MRKIYTRVITGLLSLSMLFSLVVPAYADYNGSGSGSGSLDGSGSWWVNKQGVRVSIVDKEGNTVLNGNSGGKSYSSIDIVFKNPGDVGYLTGNKFQGMGDGDNLLIGVGSLNLLINRAIDANKYLSELKKLPTYSENYPDSYSGLPLPILENENGKYVGNGEAVKNFFIKGSLGSFTIS